MNAWLSGGAKRAQANELGVAGIELFDGDLTKPETLAGACAGVETMVTTAVTVERIVSRRDTKSRKR